MEQVRSIPLNNSWLLGGVHVRLSFYLASPRTEQNLVDHTYGFTVTGRELIGLTTFGYALNSNTSLGEVFECADTSKATLATFCRYETTFQAVKKQPDYLEEVDGMNRSPKARVKSCKILLSCKS